jgi:hypothetical protein
MDSVVSGLVTFVEDAETGKFLFLIMLIYLASRKCQILI